MPPHVSAHLLGGVAALMRRVGQGPGTSKRLDKNENRLLRVKCAEQYRSSQIRYPGDLQGTDLVPVWYLISQPKSLTKVRQRYIQNGVPPLRPLANDDPSRHVRKGPETQKPGGQRRSQTFRPSTPCSAQACRYFPLNTPLPARPDCPSRASGSKICHQLPVWVCAR